MILYLDASAFVKRYLIERGGDLVAEWMDTASEVVCCRIGFVETYRAISAAKVADLPHLLARFERDWEGVTVIELDEVIALRAAHHAYPLGLRSMDAVHLAAALSVATPDLHFATWDDRLWDRARAAGLSVLPDDGP